MPNRLSDMIFDEVSLVYKGANQHSRVAIAKSADGVEQEEAMGYTDQDGNPVDVDNLQEGDVVFDEEGQGFVFTEGDGSDYEVADAEPEPVLAGVGKSFGRKQEVAKKDNPSFEDDVRYQLSKALTDEDRDAVITKAAGYITHLEQLVSKAQSDVEQEREIRREAEYMEIAKSYGGLPVSQEELASALMDCAENLDDASIVTLQKCLAAASDAISFDELGSTGGGYNSDVMAVIEQHANSGVAKSDGSTQEAEIAKAFEADPNLYLQYLQETGGYNNRPGYL